MVPETLVMMAVDSGQLKTAADIDILLRELSRSSEGCGHHRDLTYRQLEDALIDARTYLISKAQLAQLIVTEPTHA